MQILGYSLVGWLFGAFLNWLGDALPGDPDGTRRAASPGVWAAASAMLGSGGAFPTRRLLVEAGTAGLFGLLWWRLGPGLPLALSSFYALVMVLTFVTDVEHRRILNVVMLPAIAVALVAGGFDPRLGLWTSIAGGAAGAAIFAAFLLLGRALFGPGALGEGDVTLAAFLGLITGFPVIVLVVIAAILLGGIGGALVLLTRKGGRRSYMPYGPYLIIAGMGGLLYGQEIVCWYLHSYIGLP